MLQKEGQSFTVPFGQWVISFAVALAVTNGSVFFYNLLREQTTAQKPVSTSQEIARAITTVGALGRLEPEGEITRLSAPASLEGTRIVQVLVKQGDKVQKGQVVAILDSHDRRKAALNKAKTDILVARARLAQVKAGAKQGKLDAQKAAITRLQAELEGQTITQKAVLARLEAELSNAKAEDIRYQQLYEEGAISASESDSKRLRVDTTQELLNEARAALKRTTQTIQRQIREAQATLESIAEVRSVDVQLAQAELDSAIAAAKQAEADLDLTYIRALVDGQILRVHVRPGEVIGSEGIAEIGQTDQMYVVAEVYETDIAKVRLGQKASITGAAFPGKLQGEVAQIGLQVNQQNVFETNPLVETDNKVVEVKIRLDSASSKQVAGLSNLQVQVVIHLGDFRVRRDQGTTSNLENVPSIKGSIRSQSLSEALIPHQQLSPDQIADIRLASSFMTGAKRRAFQAEMALKYCRGSARLSETVFGWKRQTVALGLAEKRSGITCVGPTLSLKI